MEAIILRPSGVLIDADVPRPPWRETEHDLAQTALLAKANHKGWRRT